MTHVLDRIRSVDLSYTIRIPKVTEELYDELVDEDTRAELLDGVMIVHSPASPRHGDLACFLLTLMRCYAARKKLGKAFGQETTVHLATCRIVAPDVFFYERDRIPQPLPRKQFEGAPNLVVEVLSPSNRDDDLNEKRPAYQQAGVGEIWLVDPEEQTITVDLRRRKRYNTSVVKKGRLHATVMQGFWIKADWLWSDPLPDELVCLEEIVG